MPEPDGGSVEEEFSGQDTDSASVLRFNESAEGKPREGVDGVIGKLEGGSLTDEDPEGDERGEGEEVEAGGTTEESGGGEESEGGGGEARGGQGEVAQEGLSGKQERGE